MFIAQLVASVIVWGLVIARLFRSREALMGRAAEWSRARRTGQAVLLLMLAITVLALAMLLLARGGLTSQGLTLWGWLLVTVAGGAFVVLQTMALVPLLLNAARPVTREGRESSDTIDPGQPRP